jgi:hypothetical protein
MTIDFRSEIQQSINQRVPEPQSGNDSKKAFIFGKAPQMAFY